MLNSHKMTVAALALLALSAPAHSTMSEEKIEIEIDQDSGTVRLTAVSTGCTKAEHFQLSRNADGDVTAVRERPDRCRRKAFDISFDYVLDEIPLKDDAADTSQG